MSITTLLMNSLARAIFGSQLRGSAPGDGGHYRRNGSWPGTRCYYHDTVVASEYITYRMMIASRLHSAPDTSDSTVRSCLVHHRPDPSMDAIPRFPVGSKALSSLTERPHRTAKSCKGLIR